MKRNLVKIMVGAVLCSSLTFGADSHDKAPSLDGTWVPSSAEIAGKKLPAAAIASWKLVLKDADYTFTSNEPTDKGTKAWTAPTRGRRSWPSSRLMATF